MQINGIEFEMLKSTASVNTRIIVDVDECPRSSDHTYTPILLDSNDTLYVSRHESGVVSYMVHQPEKPSGSAPLTITKRDGSEVDVTGAWSSRPAVVNEYADYLGFETAYVTLRLPSGSLITSGIDKDVLERELTKHAPGVRLEKISEGKSSRYGFYVTKKGE